MLTTHRCSQGSSYARRPPPVHVLAGSRHSRVRGARAAHTGGATGSGQRASANCNCSRHGESSLAPPHSLKLTYSSCSATDMPRTDMVAPSARYLLAEARARRRAPVGRNSAVKRFARPVAPPGKQLRASGTLGRWYRMRICREPIPSRLWVLQGDSAAPTRTPSRRACSHNDDRANPSRGRLDCMGDSEGELYGIPGHQPMILTAYSSADDPERHKTLTTSVGRANTSARDVGQLVPRTRSPRADFGRPPDA